MPAQYMTTASRDATHLLVPCRVTLGLWSGQQLPPCLPLTFLVSKSTTCPALPSLNRACSSSSMIAAEDLPSI